MRRSPTPNILFLLCILGILGIVFLFFRSKAEGFFSAAPSQIPNIWWTYWNKDELPEVVQRCIASWRKFYPEMDFRIVTPKTLSTYTTLQPSTIKWNDMPARESDIVRANLLQQYGGYWCDATNYFTSRVNFPITPDTEFVGYYIGGPTSREEFPVIENWFFGTVPRGPFMTKWRDTFMSIGKYESVDGFLDEMRKRGVDFQKIGMPSYLAMHIAAQFVLQKEYGADAIKKHMVLLKAEDGPFEYLSANDWKSQEALDDICRGNHKTSMIKFRGGERGVLEHNRALLDCVIPPSETSKS